MAVMILSALLPEPVSSQAADGHPEAELAATQGGARLRLLVELTLRDRHSDPARAVIWGAEALEILAEEEDVPTQIQVSNALCAAYLQLSRDRECVQLGEQAVRLARASGDRKSLAEALSNLGQARIGLTEIHRSIELLGEAIALHEELGDMASLAPALNDRCTALGRRGDYPEALEDCLRSRRIYEDLGNVDGLTRALLGSGNVLAQLGQTDEALRHYLDLLQLESADESTLGSLLNNIGYLYTERGELDTAIGYLERALSLSQEGGRTTAEVRALNNLGDVHQRRGEPEKALSYFYSALEKARGAGLKRGSSSALANIGMVRQERRELSEAAEMFEEAVEILKGSGEYHNLRLINRTLSQVYSEAGRHEKALEAYQRYSAIYREIYDQETGQAQAELQARFESERQKREIELLGRRQAVVDLELARHKDLRRAMMLGFVLFLGVVLLAFHRHQLASRAALMQEAVEQERSVNRRLRKADRLKDEFLANTSHELRTPLYGLTGLAESLLDGAAGRLPKAAREDLAMLVASGRQLSKLIDEVLDISKIHQRPDLDLLCEPVSTLAPGKISTARSVSTRIEAGTSAEVGPPAEASRLDAAASEAAGEEDFPAPKLETRLETGSPEGGGIRVLVVDDEPINLQVISNYLALEGFQLTLTQSGGEGLRRFESETFDLVLLDVMMPELSGLEVCRSLRRTHPLAELPVIFLTAKDRDPDVIDGLEAGANDYLAKPVSKDRLLARVRPHLELLHLHRNMAELVAEKVSEIKILSGMLPICGFCKKIRDDQGFWSEVEHFIDGHSEAAFSHGVCPDCEG